MFVPKQKWQAKANANVPPQNCNKIGIGFSLSLTFKHKNLTQKLVMNDANFSMKRLTFYNSRYLKK